MATERKINWGIWIFLLLVLGGAAGAGYWYFTTRNKSAVEYQVVTVTKGDLTQQVTATGQLAPVVNVQVGSQISGIIRKLLCRLQLAGEGQPDHRRTRPRHLPGQRPARRSGTRQSKANLALAEVQARRADELFKSNLIAESDYDSTMARCIRLEAGVQIATRPAAERPACNLSRCTIYAPVDGVVISRNVDVGQTVAASLSAPVLFVIANDLTKMQIDANVVPKRTSAASPPDQDVKFTVDAFPYRTFHGKVSQVRNGAITTRM